MVSKIGFVEDDEVIRENYADLLRDEGYDVITAVDSDSARLMFDSADLDLVILDVSLGSESDGGYQLCVEFRSHNRDVPVIFLTSHDTETDHVSGLRVGADDYLSKASSFPFLLVRIQTLLRRFSEIGKDTDIMDNLSSINIDSDKLIVEWKGKRVSLPLTQFWILRELVESKTVCGYERLMQAANITVEPNTIAAHIRSIRMKFKTADPSFDGISTERTRGYRWVG